MLRDGRPHVPPPAPRVSSVRVSDAEPGPIAPICRSRNCSALPTARRELMISRLVVSVVADQTKLRRRRHELKYFEMEDGARGTHKTITKREEIGETMAMTKFAMRKAKGGCQEPVLIFGEGMRTE
jgi:hypothetical protein